jgi:PAS domain S-box-containing protein
MTREISFLDEQDFKHIAKLNDIISNSPIMVFLWKNTERWPIEYVSINVQRILGYSTDEFTTCQIRYADIVHPEDLEQVKREVALYSGDLNRTSFSHQPYRLVTNDGKVRWVEDRTSILRDNDGVITYCQGVVLDVTDRMSAEEALLESEEKYRHLFYEAQVALFRTSVTDGSILEINERYAHLAGYSSIADCKANFNPGGAWVDQNSREELKTLLAQNTSVQDYEAEVIRSDGTPIWISISATIYPEKGHIEGSIEDITLRKNAYQQLENMNTALNVLFEKRKRDLHETEEKIAANHELLIEPIIQRLRSNLSHDNQRNLLDILESNLKDLLSPFSERLSDPSLKLTPSEIQIASFIKQGLSDKETANILNISLRTVTNHRMHMRKKLGLTNTKVNLRSFLMTKPHLNTHPK